MGTPEFAVYSLDALLERGDEVALVISQEDKPKDRGKKIQMPAVKKRALEKGIPVYQPKTIKDKESFVKIKELNPDVIVVTAYGQIIPKNILDLPKYGAINVHASLLPKYRGAAPINFAIIHGEKETGITTMYMSEGLDTGDMIQKDSLEILSSDTSATLHDKLAELSKVTLKRTLDHIEKGVIQREPQDHSSSSYAPLIKKSLGHIDFSKSPDEISNLIRGLDPWPSAYAFLNGESVKLWSPKVGELTDSTEYGEIHKVHEDHIDIVAGGGFVSIYEIQFPNKKRMSVKDYLKGNKLIQGEMFE